MTIQKLTGPPLPTFVAPMLAKPACRSTPKGGLPHHQRGLGGGVSTWKHERENSAQGQERRWGERGTAAHKQAADAAGQEAKQQHAATHEQRRRAENGQMTVLP
jgi:hypothetical protein